MKKTHLLLGSLALTMLIAMPSCRSHKAAVSTNRMYDDNSLKIQKNASATNNYTIKVDNQRIKPYTIRDKKKLKGLTLKEAQEKVLQEAVIYTGCAVIVEPNYMYDMKGKKVKSITVVGYPGYYNFEKDNVQQ